MFSLTIFRFFKDYYFYRRCLSLRSSTEKTKTTAYESQVSHLMHPDVDNCDDVTINDETVNGL